MPANLNAPVMDAAERPLEDAIGIACSGGGYRAMLFHLGAFWRLADSRILFEAARISSVSGGSVTSAKIALEWPHLATIGAFVERVVEPIRRLASTTIDAPSVLGGVLLPGTVADRVSKVYRQILFGDATLQHLPDAPRFVINATNLETGSIWRFSKPYMGDWQVGLVDRPDELLANAVTASSAFPPILSPYVLDVDPDGFRQGTTGPDARFRNDISLTDGGVYDNLGLETVYKRYKTLLVSDAGGALVHDPSPPSDWLRSTNRVLDIIHAQVSSVRTRQLVAAFRNGERRGSYWGIRTDIADGPASYPFPVDPARAAELAATPTRLKRLPAAYQERLINWGYAACDAGLRSYFRPSLTRPDALPYPQSGI